VKKINGERMRKYLILITFLISVALCAKDFNYKFIDSKTNKEITFEKLTEELVKYDVIFFGEWHDDELLHILEADILLPIYEKNNNIAITMEMFERDVQTVLDSFLIGKIEETDFLKKTRAWSNYDPDYKPIIEFAKKHNLPVIAANIPRRYASRLSKQGYEALLNLPENEKQYFAEHLTVLEDEYQENFFASMKANFGGKFPPGMEKRIYNMYMAQSFKDDTMAESIHKFLQENPGTKVIHYNGEFHSSSHLGTAQKLTLMNSGLKIAVISPILAEDELVYSRSDLKIGDFLIVMNRYSTEEELTEEQKEKMFKAHNGK
jgi:uncharacterized iron-regulated protein